MTAINFATIRCNKTSVYALMLAAFGVGELRFRAGAGVRGLSRLWYSGKHSQGWYSGQSWLLDAARIHIVECVLHRRSKSLLQSTL